MMTDPIADMLTRMRNAILRKKEAVDIPMSKEKQAIAETLKTVRPGKSSAAARHAERKHADIDRAVPFAEKSSLAAKISEGGFVKLVEMVPPRGGNPRKVLDAAASLSEAGIDAINIPDSPRASSRMSR